MVVHLDLPVEVSRFAVESHSCLSQLCRRSRLNAYLGVLQDDAALCVDACETAGSPRGRLTIGQRQPLYCSGLGKGLLMGMADAELAWTAHALLFAPWTAATIISPERLLHDIAASRIRGWAFDDREFDPAILSIAAPLAVSGRVALAALGVSWESPNSAVDPANIGPLVVETACVLSCKIGNAQGN